MLNPSQQIERHFTADRTPWKLLSLQTQLKQAKSTKAKTEVALQIQETIRSLSVLYTDLPTAYYQQGVKFGKENAGFYANAQQYADRSGNRVGVRQAHTGGLCLSVNGRSID